jgi:hypothetical protein
MAHFIVALEGVEEEFADAVKVWSIDIIHFSHGFGLERANPAPGRKP